MNREKKVRILLLILTPILLLLMWNQFSSMGSKPRSNSGSESANQVKAPAADTNTQESAASEPTTPVVVTRSVFLPGSDLQPPPPDPFKPVVRMDPAESRINEQGSTAPRSGMVGLPPFGGGNSLSMGSSLPVKLEKPNLKGVILGRHSLAVLEYKGQINYCRTGDVFGGKYQILAIQDDRVILHTLGVKSETGGKRISLPVGEN